MSAMCKSCCDWLPCVVAVPLICTFAASAELTNTYSSATSPRGHLVWPKVTCQLVRPLVY